MLGDTDLPLDDKGRLPCKADLTVKGVTGVFSAGDCAAVPDLTKDDPNALCGPSAQHAVRQAKVLAGNVASLPARRGVTRLPARLRRLGRLARPVPGRRRDLRHQAARASSAWLMHRTYHVSRMPTLNRKVRVIADWTGALLFRREVVSLGQLQRPRTEFQQAAGIREFPDVS